MSARDLYHSVVRQALENDGWTITHDPYNLQYEDVNLAVDLGAEKLIAAEKENRKIAIEVKSFLAKSTIYAFHEALGQYINYKRILEWTGKKRTLYLAIPNDIYNKFFVKPFASRIIKEEKINLIVFNPEENHINKWIP